MTPLYDYSPDVPASVLEEDRQEPAHWCRDCLGHTWPGSPCFQEDPPAPAQPVISQKTWDIVNAALAKVRANQH